MNAKVLGRRSGLGGRLRDSLGAERIRVSRAEASGKFPFQCRTTRDRLADEVERVRPNDWREPRRGVRWEREEGR